MMPFGYVTRSDKRTSELRGGVPEGITSQIFAVGGGELVTRETFDFDKLVVEASGRSRPWSLCITAASNDDPETCNAFGNVYGDALRCRTDYLRIFKGEPDGDDYKRKIARNEIFYFSDGDARQLADALSQFEIAQTLREAYQRGAIFCGVGAGAAVLGVFGIEPDGDILQGLGLEDIGIGYVSERLDASSAQLDNAAHQNFPTVILPYMTALNVTENRFRIIGNRPEGAMTLYKGETKRLANALEYADISALRQTNGEQVSQLA